MGNKHDIFIPLYGLQPILSRSQITALRRILILTDDNSIQLTAAALPITYFA